MRVALPLAFALGLVACGSGDEPAPAPPPAQETQATPAEPIAGEAAPQEQAPKVQRTAAELLDAARTAMNSQQMFSPPGENAFELYMDLVELEPDNRVAKNALIELFPFVMIGMEQRLGASDIPEARRILALLERADAQAPALPRLRNDLAALERRESEAEARRIAEEERRAEAEAAAARAAEEAARAPEPAPTPAPAQPEPAPVVTPPPAATPTPAPAPARPPAPTSVDQLRVLEQTAPRYPPQAYRRRQEGTVEIEFVVNADGTVGDVTVVRADPRGVFDREAINAMKQWRFEAPGRELRGRRAIDFKLE
jgi:protein TonB